MKRSVPGLLTLLLSACAEHESASTPGIDAIRASNLKADLHFIASDQMRGRFVGTPEAALAAEFIKARFERLGLAPVGPDGSYYQPFELATFSLDGENILEVAGIDGAPLRLAPGRDFCPLNFSATSRAQGALIHVGFGIVAPALGHDDYRDADVRDKIVLVFEHEPGETDPNSPFDGLVTSIYSTGWRKAVWAQERGAKGILFVADIRNHPETRDLAGFTPVAWPSKPRHLEPHEPVVWMDRVRIPAALISVELASRLTAGSGRTVEELSKAAETPGGTRPVALPGPSIDFRISVRRHQVEGHNVLGLLEGSDPALKHETVIVCAHLDHDGAEADRVLPGADDNGSGTVAVLEIAEAWIRSGRRPRRSILFVVWDAEERPLLGSWYYTERPLRPLKDTVAVLNMDMIGRNEEVPRDGGRRFRGLEVQSAASNANAMNLLGYSRSRDMARAVERANAGIGLELKFRYDNNISNLLRRSDHWPFLQNGIPAVWFFTGLHPDYHMPGDRPEAILYPKMERVARLVYQTSWDLANADGRPRLDPR